MNHFSGTRGVNSQKASHGFTLIELLVVVAIIAVLIAMLLPALNSARAMAKNIACGANMRQIGIVVSMYANTYNDTLPNSDLSNWWYNWSFRLVHAGFVKDSGPRFNGNWLSASGQDVFKGISTARPGEVKTIFHCPSVTTTDLGSNGLDFYVNAYGSPQGVMGASDGTTPYSKLSMFPRPDYTIAAFDGTYFVGSCATNDCGAVWAQSYWEMPLFYVSTRHSGGSNCLFLDGHVNIVRPAEMCWKPEMFPDRGWLTQPH